MEFGGIHGQLPYSVPGAVHWSAFARGEVGMDLFGVPVKALVDLGTDLPVRGQRNSVRFAFDAPRMLHNEQWTDAHALHDARSRLDSLNIERAAQFRRVKGADERLAS